MEWGWGTSIKRDHISPVYNDVTLDLDRKHIISIGEVRMKDHLKLHNLVITVQGRNCSPKTYKSSLFFSRSQEMASLTTNVSVLTAHFLWKSWESKWRSVNSCWENNFANPYELQTHFLSSLHSDAARRKIFGLRCRKLQWCIWLWCRYVVRNSHHVRPPSKVFHCISVASML